LIQDLKAFMHGLTFAGLRRGFMHDMLGLIQDTYVLI
jgi:hypothetical protein